MILKALLLKTYIYRCWYASKQDLDIDFKECFQTKYCAGNIVHKNCI